MTESASSTLPPPDFSMFGRVETASLSKIQLIGGQVLARNWSAIPHVSHQDEADVTESERWRRHTEQSDLTAKPSSLSLYAKAVVATLTEFPKFNRHPAKGMSS